MRFTVNRIIHGDARDVLLRVPDSTIQLTPTSSPYDDMRIYGGHPWNWGVFKGVEEQLWRVTCPGGIVCWDISNRVVAGSETCTAEKQKCYFSKRWNVHNEIVLNIPFQRGGGKGRYGRAIQRVYVFSKGAPRAFNGLCDRKNRTAGQANWFKVRDRDGTLSDRIGVFAVPEFGQRSNVWDVAIGTHVSKDRFAFEHPSLMSESLAEDLILSWSRPGDIVLDPFCGSGTTCKMAALNNRYWIGIEIHEPYYELAVRRMESLRSEADSA